MRKTLTHRLHGRLLFLSAAGVIDGGLPHAISNPCNGDAAGGWFDTSGPLSIHIPPTFYHGSPAVGSILGAKGGSMDQ